MNDDVIARLRAVDPAQDLAPLDAASLDEFARRARADGTNIRSLSTPKRGWLPIAGSGIAAAVIMAGGGVLFAAQAGLPAAALRPPNPQGPMGVALAPTSNGSNISAGNGAAIVGATRLYGLVAPTNSGPGVVRIQQTLSAVSADPATKVVRHIDHGIVFWSYLTPEGTPCLASVSVSAPAGTCGDPWIFAFASSGTQRQPSPIMSSIVGANTVEAFAPTTLAPADLERATAVVTHGSSRASTRFTSVFWTIERNDVGKVIAASGVLGTVTPTSLSGPPRPTRVDFGPPIPPRLFYGCRGATAYLFDVSTTVMPTCKP